MIRELGREIESKPLLQGELFPLLSAGSPDARRALIQLGPEQPHLTPFLTPRSKEPAGSQPTPL
jgi:hypothetical protein